MLPIAASLSEGFSAIGSAVLCTLAAARAVGRITACGSCPKSTAPATSYGCSWRQDRESCVSPLPACCTKKRGGNGPRRVQFWVSPRDLPKIPLLNCRLPGRLLAAMPGHNGWPSGKGPPPRAIPALSGGGGLSSLDKSALDRETKATRTLQQTSIRRSAWMPPLLPMRTYAGRGPQWPNQLGFLKF